MSTNINIGFMERRSCSRILKPPGGGYSDGMWLADYKEDDHQQKVNGKPMKPPANNNVDLGAEHHHQLTSFNGIQSTENSKKTTITTTDDDDVKNHNRNCLMGTSSGGCSRNGALANQQDENDNHDGIDARTTSVIKMSDNNNVVEDFKDDVSKSPNSCHENKSLDSSHTIHKRVRVPPGGFSTALW